MEQAKDPASADEVLTFVQMFFMFIRTGEQLSYWWKFFKARLAPILYPHECQSLELLNKSDGLNILHKMLNNNYKILDLDNLILVQLMFIY